MAVKVRQSKRKISLKYIILNLRGLLSLKSVLGLNLAVYRIHVVNKNSQNQFWIE